MTLGQQKLNKYLTDREPELTKVGFAKIWGCSAAYLSQVRSGVRKPSALKAYDLVQVTLGVVDPIDWYQEADDE